MDLNLVTVFVAIYETRSLTAAGERLYVSQSAISQSLSKLRAEFSDLLFERVGREMIPTTLADETYPRLRTALDDIRSAVSANREFNPSISERKFRIGLSELGEIGWLPAILSEIHRLAPKIQVDIKQLDNENLANDLNRGNFDLAISPIELKTTTPATQLKRQKYVLVLSTRHKSGSAPISLEDYASLPRVEIASDSGMPLLQQVHKTIANLQKPVARIQHFATLPGLISNSDCFIAAVPETIARGWSKNFSIQIKELPFTMEPIRLRLYKRQTSDSLPALDWIFNVVTKTIRSSSTQFDSLASN